MLPKAHRQGKGTRWTSMVSDCFQCFAIITTHLWGAQSLLDPPLLLQRPSTVLGQKDSQHDPRQVCTCAQSSGHCKHLALMECRNLSVIYTGKGKGQDSSVCSTLWSPSRITTQEPDSIWTTSCFRRIPGRVCVNQLRSFSFCIWLCGSNTYPVPPCVKLLSLSSLFSSPPNIYSVTISKDH